MRTLTALMLVVAAFAQVHVFGATTGQIVQVNRALQMHSSKPRPPKNYFVNLGAVDGLTAGMILEVVRELGVVDGRYGTDGFSVRVPLGHIRVLGVDSQFSWGRLVPQKQTRSLPGLSSASLMIGDRVVIRQAGRR